MAVAIQAHPMLVLGKQGWRFRHVRAPLAARARVLSAAPLLCAGLILLFSPALGNALAEDTSLRSDEAELGRQIFNGKGICSYCHGRDGHVKQRPSLKPETEAVIKRLAPHAPDLRNSDELRVTTDRERFTLIREGHSGTGMLPDTRLTDKEIAQILAYLSVLREQRPTKP